MKNKLLLINPWIYDFTAFDLWSQPLGLLYLASFLRRFEYEIAYIDCPGGEGHTRNKKYGTGHYPRTVIEKPAILDYVPRHYARYGISEEKFISRLIRHKDASAVLVTSIMTYWYPGVQNVVRLVRKYLPDKPVILGGIYATLLPEHAKRTIQPDYLITGPGELKILELLSSVLQHPFNREELPKSLDDYPYPAFDLLERPKYLLMMTARGCPYDCSFCAQKKIAMPYTRRSPENVIREFHDHYERFKIRDFAFYDDALFIAKEKHIEVILEKIIESRLPLRLHSPNGLFAKYIDKRLADLMYRSGFKTIRISFETSNEERRKDMYSKVSNEAMTEAVRHLTEAGYRPSDLEAYVLMGLPDQPVEEVIASIIFVNNLGVQVKLASFSPIPGTLEYRRAVDRGLIPEDIDPLLTNKSIYPLADPQTSFELFRKIRTFAMVLNESARRGLRMFDEAPFDAAIKSVANRITE